MKKLITIICICFLTNNSVLYSQTNACVQFKEYESLKSLKEKANWLKQNSEKICEGKDFLYNKIYVSHEISQSNFESRILNSKIKTGTIYTWNQINQLISNYKDYEKYIAFDITSGTIKLTLIDEFQEISSCYSIALFRCIYNKNKTKFDNGEYVFEFFIDQNNDVIFNIFDIKNNKSVSNHNISSIPL